MYLQVVVIVIAAVGVVDIQGYVLSVASYRHKLRIMWFYRLQMKSKVVYLRYYDISNHLNHKLPSRQRYSRKVNHLVL